MGRASSKYPGFSADSKRLLIAEGSLMKPAALAGLSSTDTSISSDGSGLSGGTSGSTFPGSSGLLWGCLGALIPLLPCLTASPHPTVWGLRIRMGSRAAGTRGRVSRAPPAPEGLGRSAAALRTRPCASASPGSFGIQPRAQPKPAPEHEGEGGGKERGTQTGKWQAMRSGDGAVTAAHGHGACLPEEPQGAVTVTGGQEAPSGPPPSPEH